MRAGVDAIRQVLLRLLAILAASLIVTGASFGLVRVLPHLTPSVRMDRRSIDMRARRLRPARERRSASIVRGVPDLVVQFVLVGAIAWAGRRFLRLRLKE